MRMGARGMDYPKTWEQISVGDTFGPLDYTVSPEAADSFSRTTRAESPLVSNVASAGERIVPSTLPSGDDFPLIGLELDTGVHAKHILRLYRPLKVGEPAVTTGRVIEKYMKRGNRYLVLEYTLKNS